MKKIISLITKCIALSLLFVLTSCQSSGKTEFSVYDVDGKPVEQNSDESDTKTTNSETKTSNNSNQTKNRFVLFNFAKNKFVETDTFELFTTTSFGNLKKHTANITLDPRNQTAGFGSSYMAAYYAVLLTQETRELLAKAVDSYLLDFEGKKLDRKATKSFKQYGVGKGHIEWGTVRSMLSNGGDTPVNFGYKFKKSSPYFTISIYPIKSSRVSESERVPDESLPLNYYFTKAQAQNLVSLLREEILKPEFDNYVDESSSSILDWILPDSKNAKDSGKKTDSGDEY